MANNLLRNIPRTLGKKMEKFSKTFKREIMGFLVCKLPCSASDLLEQKKRKDYYQRKRRS